MVLEALTGCHPLSPSSRCMPRQRRPTNLLCMLAEFEGFQLQPAVEQQLLSREAASFLAAACHPDPVHRPSAHQLLAHPWLTQQQQQQQQQRVEPPLNATAVVSGSAAMSIGPCSPRHAPIPAAAMLPISG